MVKCSECGFLTVRNIYTRALEEVEKDFRECMVIPVVYDDDGNSYNKHEIKPICFVGASNLGMEAYISIAYPSQ